MTVHDLFTKQERIGNQTYFPSTAFIVLASIPRVLNALYILSRLKGRLNKFIM